MGRKGRSGDKEIAKGRDDITLEGKRSKKERGEEKALQFHVVLRPWEE